MSTAPIILVADRNHDALEYLKEELATTQFELLHAKDGHEVLSIVNTQEHQIAFAVVELELPGVNGLHLIGRLTSQEPKPKRIIATTFLEDEVLFELATHMGADVIVRKPRPEETWVGTVRQQLPDVPSWKMAPLFRPATRKQASSIPQTIPLRESRQELL
jgi:DNA-binding response OmpR family regulator